MPIRHTAPTEETLKTEARATLLVDGWMGIPTEEEEVVALRGESTQWSLSWYGVEL